MAATLRDVTPTMEPTGRTILVRQLVRGDPRQSRLVELRLGGRADRADYLAGFCFAHRKGSFDQCARRPRRGRAVCGAHGGGYAVREEGGWRRSAEEAGALSGFARRMKRSRRLDFQALPPTLTQRLKEATEEVRAQHERQGLEDHIASLTALSRLMLSGVVPNLTIRDALEVEMAIATTKARLLLTKHKLEQRKAVPVTEVRHLVQQFTDILARYVPPEQRDAVGRELALIKSRRDGRPDGQPRRR